MPRSFASLFTDDEEEEVAVVDPSLLIANCGLSDKTVREDGRRAGHRREGQGKEAWGGCSC